MAEDRLTESGGAMRAYYERRAAEYDDWWEGTGRFADRDRPGWHTERDALLDAPRGLAAGADARRRLRHRLPLARSARRG